MARHEKTRQGTRRYGKARQGKARECTGMGHEDMECFLLTKLNSRGLTMFQIGSMELLIYNRIFIGTTDLH